MSPNDDSAAMSPNDDKRTSGSAKRTFDHDSMCPVLAPDSLGTCACDFISDVRADERKRIARKDPERMGKHAKPSRPWVTYVMR